MADLYAEIRTELDTDPLAIGYAGMTDEQVVTSMNTMNRSRVRSQMTGDEVFSATSASEFAALTADKQQLWVAFTGKDIIDPGNNTNIAFVDYIFGASSDTKTNLAALRLETISRAIELFGTRIVIGDIQNARAL